MSQPGTDPDLAILFADPADEPADFGFTHRLMHRMEATERLRRRVLIGAGVAAFAVAAPLLMSFGQMRFGLDLQTLLSFALTLSAAGLALGSVGYAMREA